MDAELASPGAHDDALLEQSMHEQRYLLSRDRLLVKRAAVLGYFVVAKEPRAQLEEVLGKFEPLGGTEPFSRCLVCNTTLRAATATEALAASAHAPGVDEYWACTTCDKVYWRGSHFKSMNDFKNDVLRPKETH